MEMKQTLPTTTTNEARRPRGWRACSAKTASFAPNRPLSILAVDPGSRRTGLAVFEGTELVHARVKDLGSRCSAKIMLRETRRLVESHIRYFRPQLLVMERTFRGYRNKDISKVLAVAEEIRAVAREQFLPVVEYAPRTARLIVCGDGNATKRVVAEAICTRYPEMEIHLEQTHLWKETYWSNAFDACCVGFAYLVEKRFAPPVRPPAPAIEA